MRNLPNIQRGRSAVVLHVLEATQHMEDHCDFNEPFLGTFVILVEDDANLSDRNGNFPILGKPRYVYVFH